MTVDLAVTTTGLTDGQQADAADIKTPIDELTVHLENVLNGLQAFDLILFGSPESVTLVDHVATISKTHVALYPQGGASEDELHTINGGVQGRLYLIWPGVGKTITLKHGTDNLRTATGADFVLGTSNAFALMFFTGSTFLIMSPAASLSLLERGSSSALAATTIKIPDRSVVDEGSGVQRLLYQPSHEAGNSFWVRAAAATVAAVGVATPTIANSPANANDSDGALITLPTTSASGNAGGFPSTTFNLVRREWNPVFVAVVKTPSTLTSLRYWIGLCAAAPSDADNVGTSFIGFRYSTVAADAGWMPVTRDTTTQNVGTAIGTVDADTLYKLMLRVDSANGKVYFSVNDSAEQEVTSNLPATTTDLGFVVRVFTQTAGIRQINFNRLYVEMK